MTSDPVARYLSDKIVGAERRTRLRPMTSGEILDLSLRVYRAQGWTFLKLSVLPSLFCLSAFAFFIEYVWPALQSTRDPASVSTQVSEVAFLLLLLVVIGGPLFITGVTYTSVLVVRLASDFLVGISPDGDAASRSATEQLPRLFGVMLRELIVATGGIGLGVVVTFAGALLAAATAETEVFSGILTLIGIVIAIVGLLIFLFVIASHALVVPVATLEGATGSLAARRSKFLMKASRYHAPGTSAVWSLYGLVTFIALIVFAGSEITYNLLGLRTALEEVTSGLPLQGLLLSATDMFPAWLVIWGLVPIWACTITVIYFERRIRLEGFDIDVLASQI